MFSFYTKRIIFTLHSEKKKSSFNAEANIFNLHWEKHFHCMCWETASLSDRSYLQFTLRKSSSLPIMPMPFSFYNNHCAISWNSDFCYHDTLWLCVELTCHMLHCHCFYAVSIECHLWHRWGQSSEQHRVQHGAAVAAELQQSASDCGHSCDSAIWTCPVLMICTVSGMHQGIITIMCRCK